ncbi:MAG: 3-oxoacyl-ACP reductase FabG [Elusimicrobiota bacterium]|jgi:3-oxoacyl-[acyl-carrier protein] reductase|nr:3-oxoacyl-ACP reductase FabG [Elusimicrobiota bacterium]
MNEKIALITGGGRGIGAAISTTLARDGFDIWLNYLSSDMQAQKTKSQIESLGRQCLLLKFDVTCAKSVEDSLSPLLENNTPFVLVNNAGIKKDSLLIWMKENEWRDVISTTLNGFFNTVKTVLPFMLRRREGRIINIASAAAHYGVPGQSNYSAAKAGLIGAVKSLAVEVAKRNVLVNAISPGFIETEMLQGLPIEEILKTIPLGRLGKAEEVAELVSFLASDKANYITGKVFQVDGGIG